MSNYHDFLKEKLRIDDLIKNDYMITHTEGTLDGDLVEFKNVKTSEKKTILLTTPDSRKYFTMLYMKQQQIKQ